jgi:hypothetical protein
MQFEMSLEQIDNALMCYKGIKVRKIGIIGGEPLIYKRFDKVCELVRKHFHPDRMQLFTSVNPEKSRYHEDIKRTFGFVALNEHTEMQNIMGLHQPFTLALKDMVENEELRTALIQDCWFSKNWCGTVTPLGAYHCEIAAYIAYLMGERGWDVEPDWWKKDDMSDQIHLCQYCGACIPMERQIPANKKQKISPSIIQLLNERNLPLGEHEVVDKPFTVQYMAKWAKTWAPGNYRGDFDQGMSLGSNIDWSRWAAL